jgi:hypothetical protein
MATSTTCSRPPRQPVSGSCATATTRRPGALAWTWETAATSTRPGNVPSLGRYPHGHVPTPVQITDHVGDSSAKALLAEVLLMTKMNWNSARFAEKLPVTLRFANEVGTILRDLPGEYTPEARYAFYM